MTPVRHSGGRNSPQGGYSTQVLVTPGISDRRNLNVDSFKVRIEAIYNDLLANPLRELPLVLLGLNELMTVDDHSITTASL